MEESVKEEIKAEIKEEPVEIISTDNIIYEFHTIKTEIKEEPVCDGDEFDCFLGSAIFRIFSRFFFSFFCLVSFLLFSATVNTGLSLARMPLIVLSRIFSRQI